MRKIPYAFLLLGPSILWLIGALSNQLAVAANHGQMPVEGPTECVMHAAEIRGDIVHTCMDKNSRLKFLSDWMYVPQGMASPGDMLIEFYEEASLPCWFAWAILMIKKRE